MKRWAGIFTLFLVASIVVVVVGWRFRDGDLERRHATIRPGMTLAEVKNIMGTPRREFNLPAGATWFWRSRKLIGPRDAMLVVQFDHTGRVIQTDIGVWDK
jgi:hypothetical protein